MVGERIGAWLSSLPAATEVAVVEVPLLFESGMDGVFDTTVAVVASDPVRRERAEARGHALVGEREARQLAQDDKAARADHVISNEGSLGTSSGSCPPCSRSCGDEPEEEPTSALARAGAVCSPPLARSSRGSSPGCCWACSANSTT